MPTRSFSRLVLASLLVAILACDREPRQQDTWADAPVIIISIDTLRADHLPMYGYRGVATPHLDALRSDSILFANAYSNVPLTLPSHASMLTGLLPPRHGVRNNIGYSLDPSLPTLPRALKNRGYATGAAVSAYVLRGNVGLAPSFDFYDDAIVSKANTPVGALQREGEATVGVARNWINGRKAGPLFFLLHIFEPHSPYEPPEPHRSRYSNAYDGEIAHADAIVGDFIEYLKGEGLYDKAIVVLMSDHGEGLNDHGEPEHGVFLYRESIHVPLLLKLPGRVRAGEKQTAAVSLTDIFPTVARLTGAEAPANLDGRDLLAAPAGEAERRVYSESLYPRIHLGWSELRSLAGERYHFIEAPRAELYDMEKDPVERNNILSEERRVYTSMRDELAKFGIDVASPARIDPEEAKKLVALGYLGSTQPAPKGPLPDPKDRIGEVGDMIAAMRLVRDNRHAEAVPAFRRIIEKNPGLADAWNQLGMSLEMLGRFEEAADAYRKAIEVTPELSGEFGLRLASLYLRMERYDDAQKHAELGEKTNHGSSHLLQARIAMARKDYRRSEEQARIAEGDQFNRVPAMIIRAQGYAQQERLPEAWALIAQALREAEERKLGAVESLEYVRGDVLARMQRYNEAIESFNREIDRFPQNKQSYGSLYVVYMLTDRPSEGAESLERLVRANPNRRAYLFAATTLEAVGDRSGAALWRSRAARLK